MAREIEYTLPVCTACMIVIKNDLKERSDDPEALKALRRDHPDAAVYMDPDQWPHRAPQKVRKSMGPCALCASAPAHYTVIVYKGWMASA